MKKQNYVQLLTGKLVMMKIFAIIISLTLTFNTEAQTKVFQVDNGGTLTTGLVSYYKFDGDATDFWSTNNGTSANITYGNDNGIVNQYAVFNGSSSIINNSNTALNFTGSFTYSVWFKTPVLPASARYSLIGDRTSDNSIGENIIWVNSSSDGFGGNNNIHAHTWATSGAFLALNSGTVPATNTWYHIVFVKAADNDWRLYINGILATSSTSSRSLSNTKKVGLCIGAEDQGSSGIANYFNGSMDEVGIWNRALTLTEISNLYNSGAGNTMIILPPTVTSINPTSVINNATQPITSIGGTNFGTEMGLVGLWHLNGNSTDSSGNSNNGTNTNITYGTGKFGQGANFNGSSSKINCGTGITINGNSCFTFSLWAKVNAFQSQDFFSYNINGTYDIKIQPYPGHVYFQRDDYYVDYTGFSDVTNFHLFTMTYDGTYIKAYIDGSQVGSQVSSTGSYTASNKTFYIGARTDNSMYFNGIIDEVRLYNRALSVTEIQALYNRNNLVQVQLTKSGQTAITCNSFTLTNSTTLSSGSCPVTGAAAGQWNVVVTNPDGGSGTLTNGFTINTPATIPALTSPTATLITSNSATLGANITSDGGATITTRGTCWGTSAAPTSNCIAEGGTSTGIFAHSRTGLPNFTLIYYRGYATNSVGTGYSADGSFTTTATPATVDWNNSNVQEITLTAARSFTFTNGKSGGVYSLLINQDATGGRAITWPSNVKWIGGTAPTFTTTANAVDVVRFIFNGTNYLAVGISLDIK